LPIFVFCIKNRNGLYISANAAFAHRLGLQSVNAILGKSVTDIFPPLLAKTYLAQDEHVFLTGKEINDQLELISNRDGSLGWYLARKVPLMGKHGDVIGLASISRDLLTPGDADLRFAGLAKVISTIQANYAEDLHPPDLAALANLSHAQLERRMRKIFKLTTSQFIRKTRIEKAARRLANTDKPIIDIALDCGYGDQSAFARQFKATVGMTPGTYREAYRTPKN
ncbi:MAG: helix-turn-helix domain-containing protein, partial [Verrucomicrobiales bacterium]